MGGKYAFNDGYDDIYFITCTAIRWIDIFTRDIYRQIILDSLSYSQQHKGLNVFAWVIMSNHIHLIVSRRGDVPLGMIIGAFKSYTAKRVRDALMASEDERRKDWLLYMFEYAGMHNHNNKEFQLWRQDGSYPVPLKNREMLLQALDYTHLNPVRAGYVYEPQNWRWSSATDYCGQQGLLSDLILI